MKAMAKKKALTDRARAALSAWLVGRGAAGRGRVALSLPIREAA